MQIFSQLFYFCKQINMSKSISALVFRAEQRHYVVFCYDKVDKLDKVGTLPP